MDGVLLLVRLLLAGTFAVAGIAKFADAAGTRQSLLDFGAPGFLVRPAAFLLPLAELACALALFPARFAVWGAIGTLVLLGIFIAAIAASMARGKRPACHCFGQLHSEPVGWSTLARNLVLSAMAALTILQARQTSPPSLNGWLGGLHPIDAVALYFSLALAAVVAIGGWCLLHLLRQNGRLLLRLEAVEAELGLRASPAPPGLPVDTPAPPFRLSALDGSMVTFNALRRQSERILLIFTEPGCGGCDALMPDVARWQDTFADRVSIVPISRGPLEANRVKANEHGLRNYLLQLDDETSRAYQAEGTPTAVLVQNGLIASPVASGADAIRDLMATASAPPPLAKGERTHDLIMPDLDGRQLDLAELRDGPTLVLFWNPDCGYCQQMLGDIKAWESHRNEDAPRLLVISAGSVASNRAQGFQATVLLDGSFQVGQAFGATGTPAAVMLDAEGRVASGVGVGAEEVLALARGSRETAVAG
jgi:peroxiredoxin